MDVAAGHFLTHTQETTIQAYRISSNLELKFFKQSTPAATLEDLAQRLPGTTDFFDITADDLDGLAWQWERRDEAVVAYAQPGVAPYVNLLPVQVAVLDFGGASESNPTALAVTTTSTAFPLDGASIQDGMIKPVDNKGD